jgi:hypothetical protein
MADFGEKRKDFWERGVKMGWFGVTEFGEDMEI